ncbi:transglycosylase domain-containing protein [Uliginosibacterium sp. TH139]|uniref:transglycosylase domain-containing protein n=1 Tax=Uliginosibacterium sp. TH139 TaxID=2067453 RepID=UPI0013046849|nr:transglycosylase domain-containing protein [Uliginosibacterium sp. TH139]
MKPFRCLLLLVLLSPLAALAEGFALPAFEQVRASHLSSDALLLDRTGLPLADLRLDTRVRRLDWVPLAQLSPAMRDALLTAEDRRFFAHSGVDWVAFAGAAWQNLWGGGKRGASTLTMQLAGLLDPALRMPANRRSVAQKWDQSRAALELESKWNKQQILEAYLNLAPFRGDLQGISAASELIFKLPASRLGPSEASLLTALLRGPNAAPPLVAKRACRLAASLGRNNQCGEITRLAQSQLDTPRNMPRYRLAPHLARRVLQQGGQRSTSLLDGHLQARLLAAFTPQDDPASAVLVLDNSSGEVLAWIGALDPLGADGVVRPRLAPDWWWPYATALGIEQRQWTAASPLPLGAVIFDPRDARAATPSWMSLRFALRDHQPAALIGLHARQEREAWLERLRLLGFEPDGDTPAAPSLLQLASAWRAFAANGQWQAARWLPTQESNPRRAWRADTAFVLSDLLASPGPAGWASLWQSHASEDGSRLLIGHSERYTLALATTGNDPLGLWQRLQLAAAGDSRPPPAPPGLVTQNVYFEPALETPRSEYFLRGSEIETVTVLADGRRGRIIFPAAGLNHVLDETGRPRERWILQAESSTALRWLLDGHPLGEGQRLLWNVQPGQHRLAISDGRGEILHAIEFEVHPAPESQER